MTDLFKFKHISFEGLPKIKGSLKDFSSVKQIGNGKKFISAPIKQRLQHLSQIADFSDGFNKWGFLQFSVVIKTKESFERIDSNADTFRVIQNLERGIQAVISASPLMFEIFFSDQERSIKCRFFFVNYSSLTSQKAVSGDLSKELTLRIENNIKSRISNLPNAKVGSYMTNDIPETETDELLASIPETGDALYHTNKFSALMTDPFYRVAMQRALRTLDAKRAGILLDTLNGLVDTSDVDAELLEQPKKHKSKQTKTDEGKPDNFDVSAIDDILHL